MKRALASTVAFTLLWASHAAAQAPVGPIVQPSGLQKLSAHVWAIPDNSVPVVSNIGFVVGSKATLVVDTGLGPTNGAIVLKEAQKLAPGNALYLVTTHVHPEHDLGAQAFPATTKLIRAQTQVQEIAKNDMRVAEFFSRQSPINAELLKDARYRQADITFDTNHELDLGGVKVTLFASGQNHTLGDTAIFVTGDNVLFSGDLAMRGAPSFNGGSSVKHWLATLERLDAFKPKVVVPAHGPFGDETVISGYRRYFTTLQMRASELRRQGKTVEEAVTTIRAEQGASMPSAEGRLPAAIRSAYREAE